MNPIQVIKNKIYQNSFIKNFIFEGGRFVDNQPSEKEQYLFCSPNCKISETHDQIIKDAYLFYKFDTGAIMLLYSPIKKDYLGSIIYIDSESSIHPLGDNPFNSINDFSRSTVETISINSINDFMDDCEKEFGVFERNINESAIEANLYDEYDDFE